MPNSLPNPENQGSLDGASPSLESLASADPGELEASIDALLNEIEEASTSLRRSLDSSSLDDIEEFAVSGDAAVGDEGSGAGTAAAADRDADPVPAATADEPVDDAGDGAGDGVVAAAIGGEGFDPVVGEEANAGLVDGIDDDDDGVDDVIDAFDAAAFDEDGSGQEGFGDDSSGEDGFDDGPIDSGAATTAEAPVDMDLSEKIAAMLREAAAGADAAAAPELEPGAAASVEADEADVLAGGVDGAPEHVASATDTSLGAEGPGAEGPGAEGAGAKGPGVDDDPGEAGDFPVGAVVDEGASADGTDSAELDSAVMGRAPGPVGEASDQELAEADEAIAQEALDADAEFDALLGDFEDATGEIVEASEDDLLAAEARLSGEAVDVGPRGDVDDESDEVAPEGRTSSGVDGGAPGGTPERAAQGADSAVDGPPERDGPPATASPAKRSRPEVVLAWARAWGTRALAVAAKPLLAQPPIVRDAAGWVAVNTLFLGVCVWVWHAFFQSPGVPGADTEAVGVAEVRSATPPSESEMTGEIAGER